MATLYDLARDMREALDALDDCDGDDEIQRLVDLVSTMQYGITEKAEAYVKVLRNMTTDIEALETEIDRLKNMKQRREKTIDRLKENMRVAMLAAGMDKIKTPLGTWSRRMSPWSVTVVDEGQIEDRFLVPQPPKVNKTAMLDEFKKTGEIFPGVEISKREYVMLR